MPVELRCVALPERVRAAQQPVFDSRAPARWLFGDQELVHQALELLAGEDHVLHKNPQESTCHEGEPWWGESDAPRVMDGDGGYVDQGRIRDDVWPGRVDRDAVGVGGGAH